MVNAENAMAVPFSILATAGIGLLFPIACWAAVAFDAYPERDVRTQHWFPPNPDGVEKR